MECDETTRGRRLELITLSPPHQGLLSPEGRELREAKHVQRLYELDAVRIHGRRCCQEHPLSGNVSYGAEIVAF